MSEPAQTEKRIVSKSEYAKTQMKRLMMLWGCGIYLLLGAGCTGLCAALVCSLGRHSLPFGIEVHTWVQMGLYILLLALSLFGAVIFWRWGNDTYHQTRQFPSVIPLTRANTADLPAPESLVRASEEPVQEEESVLLRAAAQVEEKHEEQLLRAAKSRQEAQ